MPNLNINLPNIQDTVSAEAGPAILELACRIMGAKTNAERPTNEGMATRSIRHALSQGFQTRIATALANEERQVVARGQALHKGKGPALDGLGGLFGSPREEGESDSAFRLRLQDLNDLETQPVREAIRTAAETFLSTLMDNPGPVADLIAATADEMAR